MVVAFEVVLVAGAEPAQILGESTLRETEAQILTVEAARKAGIRSVREPGEQEIRVIVVRQRDANWIHRALEASHAVAGYRMIDLDG